MKTRILDEIELLLAQQPLLTQVSIEAGIKINGRYKICNQLKDEVFENYFALEIFVPNGFPDDIPIIKTIDGKIRASNYKEHVYSNGQFCLEIDTEIISYLQ